MEQIAFLVRRDLSPCCCPDPSSVNRRIYRNRPVWNWEEVHNKILLIPQALALPAHLSPLAYRALYPWQKKDRTDRRHPYHGGKQPTKSALCKMSMNS